MQYETLKAGDVRQMDDEVKAKPDYSDSHQRQWLPVRLIGHEILPCDLIAADFRRPVSK